MYAPVDDIVPDEALLQEESHQWQVTDEDHAELEREQADDAVRLYLREIGRVPLLKKADEVRLAKAIELQRLIQNGLKDDEERTRIESDPEAAFEGLDLSGADIKSILTWTRE